jgi:hypothetical protein
MTIAFSCIKKNPKLGMVLHACNSSTWEAETDLEFEASLGKTLSPKKKSKKEKKNPYILKQL